MKPELPDWMHPTDLSIIALFDEAGEYHAPHVAGQRRPSITAWSSLRKRGIVEQGFPYRLTELGRILAFGELPQKLR